MASSPESKDHNNDPNTYMEATHLTADRDQPMPHAASTRSLTERRRSNESITTPRAEDIPPPPWTGQDHADEEPDPIDSATPSETDDTPRKSRLQKSPLLTAHRLSTTSLDDVNLTSTKDNESLEVSDTAARSNVDSASLPSTDQTLKQNIRSHGFASSLPSVLWTMNKNPPSSAPPPSQRKLPSPFSWLSKSTMGSKDVRPPSGQGIDFNRRNTAASSSTLNSTLHESDEADCMSTNSKRPTRSSLKDQFKLLRMREEGVTTEADHASIASGHMSVGPTMGSPIGDDGSSLSPSSSMLPLAINPNLAPGTVSGISASPSDFSAPVDWELWQQIVNHGPNALTGANSTELNGAIKRGIPQTIRGVIWQVLASSRNTELEEAYKELVARGTEQEKDSYSGINGIIYEKENECTLSSQSSIRSDKSVSTPRSSDVSTSQEKDVERLLKEQSNQEVARRMKTKSDAEAIRKLEKAIRRDLGSRTSYSKYFVSQGSQEALFGLCKAYALFDEAVGYAQGINFIAMPLLFNMDEGEAFALLVTLMKKYGLRDMFIQDMPGLHLHLYQFERLLEDVEPALYCHLRRRGVSPQLYATQWFLTLFAYRFPLQLVLRIYDLIFEEGLESTILRFAIAIMQRNAAALLEMKDMNTVSTFLKEKLFDVYIDQQPSATSILESGFFGSSSGSDKEVYRADVMVQDACAVPLTQEMIKKYTDEWEEKIRTEKERETQLESLKHTIATHAAQIRSLEERTEKSDTEHVQLASELVRVKVENVELQDKNESLRIQVGELRNVIDRQPAEVEGRLRTEMDRIMKRNIEVQNEHRAMEEQMGEMEKSLVKTKMQYAELSENHDALKQKWADVRKALD